MAERLSDREAEKALRTLGRFPDAHTIRFRHNGRTLINFSGNDYLGLAADPAPAEAAVRAVRQLGCGSGASRLISGDLDLNRQLEEKISGLYGKEAALVFPTGYMANIGIIPALAGKNDLILSDRLNHASIIDGIRMSGASFRRYTHNDPDSLEKLLKRRTADTPAIVITDTIFSMDGDRAKLTEIADLCTRYGAFLMVDEAHANGVLGPTGLGLAEELGILEKVDLVMGTFSKALGGLGGFVTGSSTAIRYLTNTARSFIFTTGLPPAILAAALEALNISSTDASRRKRLLEKSGYVRSELKAQGWDTGSSSTQIIPVITGDNSRALALSGKLLEAGFLVMAIRPPTVPAGTARLRLSISSAHTDEELKRLLMTMEALR